MFSLLQPVEIGIFCNEYASPGGQDGIRDEEETHRRSGEPPGMY